MCVFLWFIFSFFLIVCLSVTVKWLAVKTAPEMIYTLLGGALNSTQSSQTNLNKYKKSKFAGTMCWLLCMFVTVLHTHHRMLVVVLLPHWTLLSTVVDVSRRVSCLTLVFNVVSTCDAWLRVLRLLTSKDELMCLAMVSYVLLAVQRGSHPGANSHPYVLGLQGDAKVTHNIVYIKFSVTAKK